jgi:hypothetical protein
MTPSCKLDGGMFNSRCYFARTVCAKFTIRSAVQLRRINSIYINPFSVWNDVESIFCTCKIATNVAFIRAWGKLQLCVVQRPIA